MKNKTEIINQYKNDLMQVENIVYDVCADEITKGEAMIDIMKLIYKNDFIKILELDDKKKNN